MIAESALETRELESGRVHGQSKPRRRAVPTKDRFCWECHKEAGVEFSCEACLRSYHRKCIQLKTRDHQSDHVTHALCPECVAIERAEDRTSPSPLMQWLDGSVDRLAQLLAFTIETVKAADKKGSFLEPVSGEEYPEYHSLIVNPMDLSAVEENIERKVYASTNSFLADIKWIYHNCHVFNHGVNHQLISEAKNVIRVAKQECEEIEICPDCYLNYYRLEEETYFSAVCRRPHAIVWAKLKGHPFWPAKVVRYKASKNEVDVRFFGTHDKCWLRPDKCYLMSQNYPNTKKPSKFDQQKFDSAIKDMNLHLDELDRHFKGAFQFHDKQTVFTVDKLYLKTSPTGNGIVSTDAICGNGNGINETPKVLNDLNVEMSKSDSKLKKLRVLTKGCIFDIAEHIEERGPAFDPSMSPPTKRFKGVLTKANRKCISNDIAVRQELNSSVDSSEIEESEREESEAEVVVKCVDENQSYNGVATSGNKMVTVSGKSSQIVSLSEPEVTDSSPKEERSEKSVFGAKTRDYCLLPDRIGNFINMKLYSSEETTRRLKNLEFKNRKLEEDLKQCRMRETTLEEQLDELKKTNEELLKSIEDIKHKQWCTNCQNEAILPCCWNTCYCTVECQHQHWPVHSKTCRRQRQSRS